MTLEAISFPESEQVQNMYNLSPLNYISKRKEAILLS